MSNGGVPKEAGCGAAAAILYELIFVLLPIGIVGFVMMANPEKPHDFMCAPEWAFAAVVLLGQTGAKLMASAQKAPKLNQGKLQLLSALLFVSALAATGVLLVILTKEPSSPHWICITQVVLTGMATLAFFLLGTLAHVWSETR